MQRFLVMLAGVASLSITVDLHSSDPASAESTRVASQAQVPQSGRLWVYFRDKAHQPHEIAPALEGLEATYDARAVARRKLRRTAEGIFDERDLPVVSAYVDAVLATGARLHVTSRWLNAISVQAEPAQLQQIAALPCVRSVEPVRRGRRIGPDVQAGPPMASDGGDFYGLARDQLEMINLIALHEKGFTGEGMIIGVLDTGFNLEHAAFNHTLHPIQVVAEHDFINDDGFTGIEPGDPESQHVHGTLILGTLAAFDPGEYVAAAYDAAFILCKTEDTTDEYPAEEDNYVAGLEFIEANGGDVATSSLGYIAWYDQEDLDGQTAVTTIAVNVATSNGVYCCTAAGNLGHDDDPLTSHLVAPGDALAVLTCGAVSPEGSVAGFSSDGPTADGRVKPEVLTQGVKTWTVTSSGDDYLTASGTSMATPLLAGAVACIVQAQPTLTVDQLRDALFTTADHYVTHGTFDPLYVRGYGIMDALAAVSAICPADVDGSGDIGFTDLIAVLSAWGPCGTPCAEDIDGNGEVGFTDLLAVASSWGPCR